MHSKNQKRNPGLKISDTERIDISGIKFGLDGYLLLTDQSDSFTGRHMKQYTLPSTQASRSSKTVCKVGFAEDG